jgi:hypothetical protein
MKKKRKPDDSGLTLEGAAAFMEEHTFTLESGEEVINVAVMDDLLLRMINSRAMPPASRAAALRLSQEAKKQGGWEAMVDKACGFTRAK